MQWFDVNMSGCEQGPGDPCFFDDDPIRVYLASEVDARIAELEKALSKIQDCYMCQREHCEGRKAARIAMEVLLHQTPTL
jgi:hypothetical protein